MNWLKDRHDLYRTREKRVHARREARREARLYIYRVHAENPLPCAKSHGMYRRKDGTFEGELRTYRPRYRTSDLYIVHRHTPGMQAIQIVTKSALAKHWEKV